MSASPAPGHIYVYLYGGLGNQLFQAAFASLIQAKSGGQLSFIVENFKNDGLRNYLLSQFPRLRASVVPMEDAMGAAVITEKDVRDFPPLGLLEQLSQMVAEGGRLYLSGFWQNEAFYGPFRDLLVNVLTPMLSDSVAEKVQQVREGQVIGLHMRRHGYGHMGLTKSLYYLRAIVDIRNERGDLPVHVFSDDPVYSRYLFRSLPDVHLVSNGDLANPIEDFALLSACRHQIIANSTFSWWAAWLAETPDSIIYAPQPWIIPDPLTNPVPERWRRVFDAIQEQ